MSIEGKLAAKAVGYAIPGAGEVLMAKNAAQGAAKLASYGFAACAFIMFAIFIGTLAGWIQQKNKGDKADNTKKQNLKNSWIAFLVLFCVCLILFGVAKGGSEYKIAGIV
jgi:uncharacterized Tic20 family protein